MAGHRPDVIRAGSGVIKVDHKLLLVYACSTAIDMMRWRPKNSVDVLPVDLGLPDRPGTGVISLCRSLQPSCKVMVLSIFGDAMQMVQGHAGNKEHRAILESSPRMTSLAMAMAMAVA